MQPNKAFNKFHKFMKSGRLPKVCRIAGVTEPKKKRAVRRNRNETTSD